MFEIKDVQKDLLQGLADIGFIPSVQSGLSYDSTNSMHCNLNNTKPKILSAMLCAGLYPHVSKIIRPAKKFTETIGGNLERDNKSQEFKFYVPMSQMSHENSIFESTYDEDDVLDEPSKDNVHDIHTHNLQRVFIHPTSVNFHNTLHKINNYVLYGDSQVVQSNSNGVGQVKAYLRDVSEVSALSIMLFGGKLKAQYLDGTVTVDDWIK